MPGSDHKVFGLDVWCDPDEELEVLLTELAATEEADRKRKALIWHEIGRIQLSSDNEPDAAKSFLKSYSIRPQFRPTLRLARALYRQRTDYKLAIKLLDAEARATRDPLARAALLRQQARLLWRHLGRPDDARRVLETAYRIDAADLATLKLQQLLHAIERDADGLRSAILRQLESVSDSKLHTALLVGLALLLAPTDPEVAIDTLRSADKSEPGNLSVLCTLEQIFGAERRYKELAETLVRQAKNEEATSSWRARQLARAARIQRFQIQDPSAAIELFQRSLELYVEFSAASDCFELLQDQERFAEAAEVGATLFELNDTPSLRATVACQIGDLHRNKLGDHEKAAKWYQHCLKWAPTYQPALEGLGWILETKGEVDQLLEVHRADLASTKLPQERSQRLYRIATVLERHRREPQAMEVHQEALAASPDFQPSISSLERLFTRHERWTELLQLYDAELERDPDRERAHHILETMASIWHHQMGNADNAIECNRRILDRDPSSLPTVRTTARLCAETRRWHDLVDLNEREVKLIDEPNRRVVILQRTGEVWEDQLLNLDKAMECYRRALEIDPRHLPALKALGRLYRQKRLWVELIQMHQAEIEATADPEQIISLLYDIAEIYEEEILDEEKAATTYQAILQRRSGHWPAVMALTRILKRRSDWRGLVELMDVTLDAISDDRSKALQLWLMGLLRETELSDPTGAIKDLSRALRLSPELALTRAALEQILEEQGDFHQLADLYSNVIEQTEIPSERAAISYKLATIWERQLSNPRKAVHLYERALENNPSTWCLWSLAQIYEQLGMSRELCSVLEQMASGVTDRRAAAEIQLKIGRIKHVVSLGDPIPHLRHALDLDSGERFAQRAIERTLRETGRRSELAEVLGQRIELTTDPREKACLLTELAEILVKQGDLVAAESDFREALEHAKSHLPAFAGLRRLLEEQQRYRELAELTEEEASAMESNRGLADALFRAATLWQDQVGDVPRALPLYGKVHKIYPGHGEAYQRLHSIMTSEQDWAGLASLIRGQISTAQDPLVTSNMFIELGQLYLQRLSQHRKGEACFRRALDLEPDNIVSLTTLGDMYYTNPRRWSAALKMYTRLESLLKNAEERARINQRLGDIHLQASDATTALHAYQQAAEGMHGQDPELLRKIIEAAEGAGDAFAQVQALEQLAGSSHDAEERIAVRKRIAELAVNALENDDLAVRALEETLILDPLDIEAIERLAAIYGRASNRSAANQHLQAAIAHHRVELGRRPTEVRYYLQMGRIFQWQRQFDRLYCTCVAQEHLDELDEVQQRFIWNHHRRCGTTPKVALPRSKFEAMVLPEAAKGPVRDLLASIGLGLQKRAAVTTSSLGLDKSSKVKQEHPLRAICDEIAGLLGGVDFDLWISRTQPDLIAAEMLTKPALIIGARVSQNLITPAERFRIGKALFLIAENALVFRDLSVREISQIFSALGNAAQPRCPLPLTVKQPDKVEEEAKRLTKLLSRKDRKLLGTMLPKMAGEFESISLGDFARALGFGSNRLGLVAAGDPRVALGELAQISGPQGPEMGDLLQYMVSEEYFTLRVELGFSPGTH